LIRHAMGSMKQLQGRLLDQACTCMVYYSLSLLIQERSNEREGPLRNLLRMNLPGLKPRAHDEHDRSTCSRQYPFSDETRLVFHELPF
jgi:hypothetical protein